ncbi:TPR repeat-containing [Paramyrothecium foliicola]|nr:TPR repeat-containing [Paramyrothecium foliicola]
MDPISILAKADATEGLIRAFVTRLTADSSPAAGPDATVAATGPGCSTAQAASAGLAALDAFLQSNVTGPVLPADSAASVERLFVDAWSAGQQGSLEQLQKTCLRSLDVDGVSPYGHVPHLELFCLTRYIFFVALEDVTEDIVQVASENGSTTKCSLAWTRLRINTWHYKLLTQPSLGSGSNFTRSSQWTDVPTLASQILDGIDAVRQRLLGGEVWASEESWTKDERALFLIEAANNYILLGRNEKAKEAITDASQATGVLYALSGALGKRTKWQEKSTSQLVVLARSADEASGTESNPTGSGEKVEDSAKPDALKLNDDTLLEDIQYTKDQNGSSDEAKPDILPATLAELSPDSQPQLSPLDQMILLTEATLKDAFSPLDTLTSEEILPFAVRVLADKSTNWQIYTQALLVRSRIEMHRSRTVERGVLQLQAVADQVIADTTAEATSEDDKAQDEGDKSEIPSIQVTEADRKLASVNITDKPTSFLPAPKASESAPAHVRLRYIHALSTPPRWHLEAELAYAWTGVGSLVSALEIFKRLRLWAEVALCLAGSAASEDEQGRGSGGDEKARGIVRWRLFHRTGDPETPNSDPDAEDIGGDVTRLRAADFSGPERSPAPPNAPRLWCILGELEDEPAHYERAWTISNGRYARAQKSLGEHYLQQKDWDKALAAYKKATAANRMSPDLWSRLGDICLRLGRFEEAAEAYSRCIGSATDSAGGEGARTWSNLGSALWSLYCQVTAEDKESAPEALVKQEKAAADEEVDDDATSPKSSRDPSSLLTRSLAAYKKGASISHDNWRIWDNVVTLAARMSPPAIPDMLQALRHVIRIRKSEDAIDVDLFGALVQDAVLAQDKDQGTDVYEPPRGSNERLIVRLVEEDIVPLITHRSALWALVSRIRAWCRDYAGAVEASERAWRAAFGSSNSGLLPGAAAPAADGSAGDAAPSRADWTTDKTAWEEVVRRTDELASVLETWGPDVETIGARWKGRVRSAVRSVMGRGREMWEGSEGWQTLEGILEGLKA